MGSIRTFQSWRTWFVTGRLGGMGFPCANVRFPDSNYARDAFATFIPLSVDHDARKDIIFDFFDLLAAIAAHGKTNGLAGRKLSRYAGWWAFEHVDTGNGFEGGYKGWSTCVYFGLGRRSQVC
jgi:hypothetical protein